MITISVNSKCFNATLSYPEHKRIARDYIPDVLKHIANTPNCVIETCSENIVNMAGNLIYEKHVTAKEVILIVEDEQYNFSDDGCILNWMCGYFFGPEIKPKKLELLKDDPSSLEASFNLSEFIMMS